ncbi:hypothetical protein VBD025_02920 [Virgibacillus flavescens]|uniref:hypothetical protein n=1 Tax=Virgibacillus flavescens TaxID=1611422 RepID=UPI003D34D20E
MDEKYSLNAETLKFILEFEKTVQNGKRYLNTEVVHLFQQSSYHKSVFETYIDNAINKSIWYAIKRSGNWEFTKKGLYTKKYG